MSDTPRTDAMQKWLFSIEGQMQTVCVHVEDAKKLELQLQGALNEAQKESTDWERWAIEVLCDFRISHDNHKVGLRMAIVQWMAERNHELNK